MPQRRKDADYLLRRIPELYRDHIAKEVANQLNADPNVIDGPITERIVYNTLNKIRQRDKAESEVAVAYKDKPWTEQEDATLKGWYAKGASIPMISQQVQRSVPSVHARIKTLNLANRKITSDQEQTIRDMIRNSKRSLKEISYELGVKYSAVRHVSNKLKKEAGVTNRHSSNTSLLEDGSLAERLIRDALVKEYGDAVVPWQHNRNWSGGRGWQIDIPIEFPTGLKIAVEVNHVRTHAGRRNRDYAKRHYAEELGWFWIPIWFGDELTKEFVAEVLDTIHHIVHDLQHGDKTYYESYMSNVEELERQYYHWDQPLYDPKEHAKFGNPWSIEDEDTVRNQYGKVSIEALQTNLSTFRTRHAVIHKARGLGLTRGTKNFSPEEDDIIRANYANATEDELLEKLPGRSWQGIATRASRLGVKRRDVWTVAEEEILRDNYATTSDDQLLGLLPGRSLDSIRTRAHRHGLKKNGWTAEEDDRLRRLYPAEPRSVIEAAFANRSWMAIVSRASRLGIKRIKPF
ncbi:hypothetical protein [Alicyclobacillus sp. SO9]|uniref:hypothetical protein n=1 Tax=Alicyclobacillus sp. SO9 TaxID=2665646 RepID=UPI0018E82448|nr:hypothetical protein [Alicyclobacillus sp. SO9]QQE80445.1 hypothetical protein GI364_08540 [Alicyclobacillus sp. SO9]